MCILLQAGPSIQLLMLKMQNNVLFNTRFVKKITLASLFICLSVWLGGCASTEEKLSKSSEQEVYERAQRYLKGSSWELAIQTLQALEENFPFGSYGEHAQLELIFAYFRAGEYEAAIAASDRFVRLHPQHRNVDYAFYMRGIASFYNESAFSSMFPVDVTQRDPGTAKDAFNYFGQLLSIFPESAYALDATKRMTYLRNSLARSEINVANYYFKRGAYLAAANRGRWVVENMQTTPAVPDGLAVMAQAYYLLDMKELAESSEKVLIHNFPDHPAIKDGKFNYFYGREEKKSIVRYLTGGLFGKRNNIVFDSREQYNPFYFDDAQVEAPPKS